MSDVQNAIRGKIIYADGSRPSDFTFARMVNGGERVPIRVEIDGRQFTEDGVDLQEHYRDGFCYAVTLDGVRYVRRPEKDFDNIECD